jgi:preprotein translocase subunit SecG
MRKSSRKSCKRAAETTNFRRYKDFGNVQAIIWAITIVSALAIIGLVLIQHGKGADVGAAFGSGSAGSLFGSSGAANFLSRSTSALAAVFFLGCLILTYLAAHSGRGRGVLDRVQTPAPASSTAPAPASSTGPAPATRPSTPASSSTSAPASGAPVSSTASPPAPAAGGQAAPAAGQDAPADTKSQEIPK